MALSPNHGSRRMGAGARGADDDAQRALAAGLDESAGRFAEDRDVGVQPVGQFAFDAAQTVCGGLDFLAVVHHQRDVVRWLGDRRGQMQEHRVARLHVRRAAAVQLAVAASGWAGCRQRGRCRVWPASRTRDGRPRLVRASTASPLRTISNPVVCSRSAASISSAMRCSCRDSLGMSTSAAVSAIGSPCKSRPTGLTLVQ